MTPSVATGVPDFIGNAALPLNGIFRETVAGVFHSHQKRTGETRGYCVPTEAEEETFALLTQGRAPHLLPGAVSAIGFEHIFSREFCKHYLERGIYGAPRHNGYNTLFEDAGCRDPLGHYLMFGATPYVFLIDREKLGSRPVPRRWQDLLSAKYQGSIITGGTGSIPTYILLFYFHQAFGNEGVEALAHAVKTTINTGLMPRYAGRRTEKGEAIYIMPWLFARACPKREETLIVWPEEGAFISPMWLIVRNSIDQLTRALVAAILGSSFAKRAAEMYFPMAHSDIDNHLPPAAQLKWLGWEYIRSHDMEMLKKELRGIFANAKAKSAIAL